MKLLTKTVFSIISQQLGIPDPKRWLLDNRVELDEQNIAELLLTILASPYPNGAAEALANLRECKFKDSAQTFAVSGIPNQRIVRVATADNPAGVPEALMCSPAQLIASELAGISVAPTAQCIQSIIVVEGGYGVRIECAVAADDGAVSLINANYFVDAPSEVPVIRSVMITPDVLLALACNLEMPNRGSSAVN